MPHPRTYHADWIDAASLRDGRRWLQRLLVRTHSRELTERILLDLEKASREGRSLSAMMLCGNQPVACLIAIRDDGGVLVKQGAAHGMGDIRVEGFAVHPRHRSHAALLLLRLAALYHERMDLAPRRLLLRCTPRQSAGLPMRSSWRRLGFTATVPDDQTLRSTHALVLRQAERTRRAVNRKLAGHLKQLRRYHTPSGTITVGVISTRAGWDALQPHWNGLLEATPGATVFQTFEFQRLWWNHIGWGNGLLFTVALRDDRPVAILPLQIDPRHWLGAEFRTLAFLGDTPESDRPRLLLGPGEDALPAIMAGDLLARADSWDELALAEQAQDDVFVRALYAQLTAAGFHARHGEPSEAPRVVLDGDWTGYLRGRSRALRRTLKRRRLKLERSGHVRYLSVRATAADETPFEQYLRVERASWKHGTHIGVTRDAAATSLYREVASRMAGPFAVEFRFLRRNDRTIAATFGITWRDTWYSLHVAHDRACDEWSPGVVLTALELEDAFATRRYRAFDFLSNFLANKTQWANDRIVTRDLHAMRPGPLCSAFYLVYYCWKPALKRAWTRLRNANRRPLPRTRPLVRRDEDEARED